MNKIKKPFTATPTQRFFRIISVMALLFTIFLTSTPAKATTPNSVPDNMIGFWSLPNCVESFTVLGFSKHFALMAEENLLIIQLITESVRAKDFNYIKVGSLGSAFKVMSYDHLVRSNSIKNDSGFTDPDASWDELDHMATMSYMKCEEHYNDWPTLNFTGLESFFNMDKIYEGCQSVNQSDCLDTLFTIADKNKDGVVDHDESVTVYKKLAFLHIGIEGGPFNDAYPKDMDAQSTKFADDVMAFFDKNESGTITSGEFTGFWHTARYQKDFVIFAEGVDIIFSYLKKASHLKSSSDSCDADFDTSILSNPTYFIQMLRDGSHGNDGGYSKDGHPHSTPPPEPQEN